MRGGGANVYTQWWLLGAATWCGASIGGLPRVRLARTAHPCLLVGIVAPVDLWVAPALMYRLARTTTRCGTGGLGHKGRSTEDRGWHLHPDWGRFAAVPPWTLVRQCALQHALMPPLAHSRTAGWLLQQSTCLHSSSAAAWGAGLQHATGCPHCCGTCPSHAAVLPLLQVFICGQHPRGRRVRTFCRARSSTLRCLHCTTACPLLHAVC